MPDRAPEASNVSEYSVAELSFALKRTLEDTYEHVRVRGEVSGYRGPHGSGHCYFTLKDQSASLDLVVWKSTFQRLKFKPEEGLEMVATGKITTYPRRSNYQLVVESLEPAGAGALMALLEERRKALEAEGLFAEARKRPLPYLPKVIGVVTSPTGAVIRDILHRLRERFPRHVLLWPVRVQGDGAADEVARAVRGFNMLEPGGPIPRPDLLIVARGGGSIEDLWAFNEEVAVRAVAESAIPVISAVGHETDWTLIDLAADRRAPTPTGAAEIAVPVHADLAAGLADLAARQSGAWTRLAASRSRELMGAARAMPSLNELLALPRHRLDEAGGRLLRALSQHRRFKAEAYLRLASRLTGESLRADHRRRRERLAELSGRLGRAAAAAPVRARRELERSARLRPQTLTRMLRLERDRLAACARHGEVFARRMDARKERMASAGRLLETLSYKSVLSRGYAVVHDGEGRAVTLASAVAAGAGYDVEFSDGRVPMVAGTPQAGLAPEPAPQTKPKRPVAAPSPQRAKPPGGGQGSLF
ncbi:exodeoxyribonuclease VII large subunit [Afifella sp. IM 167]|uniref:exodeoxyribonuclease VII large subunit n=1 Tax=Afifella sp. IM 167 TaxID=2033586 RepID=UPI001CCA7DF6|nr:exodeoxyribonuclease VII large subunit [Afifella sp. IM 167]MBZ8133517.1 exodeoxyribonuclease VII large subunit [Afifella sp. IM 167]